MYNIEDVRRETLSYFKGDTMATNVWIDKYCLKDLDGNLLEKTPDDMHRRVAKELTRIENKYKNPLTYDEIYSLLSEFNYIVPGGSVLFGCGNSYAVSSLGNCFVIGNTSDSYGGIMATDEEQVQLMKRRGGVGHDISHLRAKHKPVSNSAKTSTGAVSFMDRYSNSCREVAQDGRRGALMLSIDIDHPDADDFIMAKDDPTKITGANISVKVTDNFMNRLDENIARKTWNKLVRQAWKSAEPGVLFIDTIRRESPADCYSKFGYKTVSTNPCFHPDTLIETVTGRVKIKDITQPTYVYSMDESNKLCIRKASASFVTKKDQKTVKITLKNGSYIQVTNDHKLYVHNNGWVKAIDLTIGDRIVHLSRNRRGKRYSGVKLTSQDFRDYKMEHILVWEGVNGKLENKCIHHIDGNTFNNSIMNLTPMSANEHNRHTALFDNPQKHQVRDENGRFISPKSKYRAKIENVPNQLKTNLKNISYNSIVSIEDGDIVDVYDIQVPGTNCLIANNMVAHNCGEIPLCPYDSCRLLSVILPTFVNNPFTKEASFDFVRFKRVAYIAQRLMDDIVDLEEEKIDAILAKIKQDNEPDDIKDREMKLWFKIKEKLLNGRRTGLSAIGLADVAAMLNIRYDDCADIAEEIYKTLALASYESSIDMAEERGAFPIWDVNLDLNSPYINRILAELSPEMNDKFCYNGRRNIANLTIPPSGTLSLMAKIASGIEPVFMPIHKRRRKVNPDHPNKSFQDKNGDWWEEYEILHPKYKQWLDLQPIVLQGEPLRSPYYKSSAMEIDPLKKIKMLGRVQKWIDHAISQTTNLPSTATIHDVENIYIEAWKNGLKGITVYRDGCRDGVLISADEKKKEEFKQHDAPKRPKSLTCDVRKIIVKGKEWVVCIGLYEQKPYEVFAFENKWDMFKKDNQYKGFINKVAGGDYDLHIPGIATFENITDEMTQGEEDRTRMISTSLRHGANVKFIIEQLNKSKNIDITSFSKAIARALKYYIKDGETSGESCPLCGGKIIYKDGCKECADCGEYSKCG